MINSNWTYDDGGRKAAGFKGKTGDCVVRAIAIATEKPYKEVYDSINVLAAKERRRKGCLKSNSRTGVHRWTLAKYLSSLGWQWVPTMHIGSGCKIHLTKNELPSGRLIVSCSRHIVAVVDGVIHDIHDPARDGTRCVYGYWTEPI